MVNSFFVSTSGLSVAGNVVLFSVLGPLAIILVAIIVLNILQVKKPEWLPNVLKNWEFLPPWMHSLDPMDKVKINSLQQIHYKLLSTLSYRKIIKL